MRDTIELAREAGESIDKNWLERFAALVRADERERLAKIQFESILQAMKIEREACAKLFEPAICEAHRVCAAAIRARGQA